MMAMAGFAVSRIVSLAALPDQFKFCSALLTLIFINWHSSSQNGIISQSNHLTMAYNNNEYSYREYMENISYALLGFLLTEPKYGYELYKEITDPASFGAIYSIKIGRRYAQLNKLEQEKFVHATSEVESTRPPRKVYTISAAGKEAFFSWMESAVQHGRDIRINLLIKLFFSLKIKSIRQRNIIEDQVKECESWLKRIEENGNVIDEKEKFSYLVRQFRKSQIEGYINWLNWCLRRTDDD